MKDKTDYTPHETLHLRRFSTVKELACDPRYPFTESALRHLIFQAQPRINSAGETIAGNGLGRAIRRCGAKVLISMEEFDRWLDENDQIGIQGGN